MVDDFLKLRENIHPQIQESQQILSRIQKKTKTKTPWHIVKLLKTNDKQQILKSARNILTDGDPAQQGQELIRMWVSLLCSVQCATDFKGNSYLGCERGLVQRVFLSFPAPPSAFSYPTHLGHRGFSFASSCFFPVGALPLDSELALFWKHFGCPLRWAASTLGRPCKPGLWGQGFLSTLRHASVIHLSLAREDLLLTLQ